MFDTQSIIERAHRGDLDYVKHALLLFSDLIGILVRILIIMVCGVPPTPAKSSGDFPVLICLVSLLLIDLQMFLAPGS